MSSNSPWASWRNTRLDAYTYRSDERSSRGSNRQTQASHYHSHSRTITPGTWNIVTSAFFTSPFASGGAVHPGEGAGLEVEHAEDTVPILAKRAARLELVKVPTFTGWGDDLSYLADDRAGFELKPMLGSLNKHFGTFDVDADAICRVGNIPFMQGAKAQHAAPDLACSCGFYAVPASASLEPFIAGFNTHNACLTLDVELSGTVIEHELGYRASHQRVLAIQAPSCFNCGDKIVWWSVDNQFGFCARHKPKIGLESLITRDVIDALPVPVTYLTGERR